MKMNDTEFLEWIYERLVYVHGENEKLDYMITFKKAITKMKVIENQMQDQNEESKKHG